MSNDQLHCELLLYRLGAKGEGLGAKGEGLCTKGEV